jgi:hypothetical protein
MGEAAASVTMFHPVVTQIRTLLETEKVPYKFFEHEAVHTTLGGAEHFIMLLLG